MADGTKDTGDLGVDCCEGLGLALGFFDFSANGVKVGSSDAVGPYVGLFLVWYNGNPDIVGASEFVGPLGGTRLIGGWMDLLGAEDIGSAGMIDCPIVGIEVERNCSVGHGLEICCSVGWIDGVEFGIFEAEGDDEVLGTDVGA